MNKDTPGLSIFWVNFKNGENADELYRSLLEAYKPRELKFEDKQRKVLKPEVFERKNGEDETVYFERINKALLDARLFLHPNFWTRQKETKSIA